MAPFQFPPPPPPPPKATATDAPDQYSSQRGGFNNARGGRGRGYQGRGRGNSSRGNNRGGHGNSQQQRGAGYQQGGCGGPQQQNAPQRQNQYPSQPYTNPTQSTQAGAYVNAPVQPQQHTTPGQPAVDPMAFAQAMAYMSTPAGMQTFSAFASQLATGQQPTPTAQPPQHPPQTSSPNNKRKRDDRVPDRRPPPAQPTASKPKPPRAKAAPPPAIPSFGFSLPPVPTSQPSPNAQASKKDGEKKRKIHLGLTNREDGDKEEEEEDQESGAEEDVDEEAAFANTNIEGMSFEYNGQQISLQTPAEIAAWIKDRSKHFPTRQRIAEKAQEAAQRRANELEFLRKVQGKKKDVRQRQPAPEEPAVATPRRTSVEQNKAELGSLRARVEQSIAAKRKVSDASEPPPPLPVQTRRPINLGLGYDTESSSDDDIIDEESSVVSSDTSDEEESDSDSDGAPEEASSKTGPPAIVVPPPPPPQPVPEKKEGDGVCMNWKRFGSCNRTKCRWEHPPKEEPKMMTLFERLVEQEEEKKDRVALDAIKWLGRNGFLG